MPLKPIVTADEYAALDDARKALYVEKNGKHVLDVEGIDDPAAVKAAIDRQKARAGELEKTLADIRQKLGDADPAKAREALLKLQELDDKKLIDEGKVEELLQQRTQRLAQDYEGKLKTATTEIGGLKTRLSEVLIDKALQDVAISKKVRQTAVEDFIERGRKVFRLDKDGKVVPMKGDEVIFGKDAKPMSMDEWADALAPTAGHLFEGSGGGGAQNTPAGGGGGPHTITTAQAKDTATYRAAKAAADKAGQPLTIVE